MRPSGLNDAARTYRHGSRCSSFPLAASHSRAVLSPLAVTTVRPSGLNDAALTPTLMRKPLQFLAAGRVPEPGGIVHARGDDRAAVGAERRRIHGTVMPERDVRDAATAQKPDLVKVIQALGILPRRQLVGL